MSSLSVLRETAVTGAPGTARPPLMCHQPCQPSVKPGSQAALIVRPAVSVTKMSSLFALRETAWTGAPCGATTLPIHHQPCHPSVKLDCQAAVYTPPSV